MSERRTKLRLSVPSVCQLAFGSVSSGQLTPTEIMLIAVIFFFLLEHNQQIIYFSSFITEPLLTKLLPFIDLKLRGSLFNDVCVHEGLSVVSATCCFHVYHTNTGG